MPVKSKLLNCHCRSLIKSICYRPTVQQVKARALSILSREGVKVNSEWLDKLIVESGNDIRQVIHTLDTWYRNGSSRTLDETKTSSKDISINVFEACKRIFCTYNPRIESNLVFNGSLRTISDRLDLFFNDYSLMPLMIHENYPHIRKYKGSKRSIAMLTHLKSLSRTAQMIAYGDVGAAVLRSQSNWSLLPTIGMLSTAIPSFLSCNDEAAHRMVNFPQWLGRNSKFNRIRRAMMSTVTHVRLKVPHGLTSLRLDLCQPLIREVLRKWKHRNESMSRLRDSGKSVDSGFDMIVNYYLLKDDITAIDEVISILSSESVFKDFDSKSKAAYTRALNAARTRLPFSLRVTTATASLATNGFLSDEDGDDANENDDDITTDKMIKVSTKALKRKSTNSSARGGNRGNARKRRRGR
ncbi:hypothetical protein ACOME3_008921 [Neoechinorhynchus agilis]